MGILLLYSSKIIITQNEVNVTSKLNQTHPTIGEGNSTNSLVGIDIYFNSHNNIVSQNTVNIQAFDNYIYGMGVLGYRTGHKAPEGQGAINNTFSDNIISLNGVYFATGLIVGCESQGTIILNNTVNLKSKLQLKTINLFYHQKLSMGWNHIIRITIKLFPMI